MVEALLGAIALIAASVGFFWLGSRALRLKIVFLRWLGLGLAGLVGLLLAVMAVFGLIGIAKVHASSVPAVPEFTASTDPQVIARGQRLATILCVDCHSSNNTLPLSGGRDVAKIIPIPVGTMPAYNLTSAGPLKNWSDADIYRAIRFNVDPSGRRLGIMGSTAVGNLGDEDIRAVVAYLRSQPATGEENRQERTTLLGYILVGNGMISPSPRQATITPPSAAPDAAYGQYLVSFLGCRDCHGASLTGGTNNLVPIGPNLIASVGGWTEEQFIQTLRTGTPPVGRPLSNELMPYKTFARMDDTELRAVYAYIQTLK